MEKPILIATGGTGGHLYPAQALAERIQAEHPGVKLLFAGDGLEGNPYFDRSRFLYAEVPSAHFAQKRPLALGKAAWRLLRGFVQSLWMLARLRPAVVVGFGSYHTLPVMAAARLLRMPLVLHEGNAIPGKVNRLFSRGAYVTAIQFPGAATQLNGRVLEVQTPLREGYTHVLKTREQALEYFGLDDHRFTFLVFGGSQGARSINALFVDAVSGVLREKAAHFQVIHLTGDPLEGEEIREEYRSHQIFACVKTFEPRMDLAWMAADLAISRAGALSLAEQLEFEVPAILIPYPYAADGHQEANADFMEKEVEGAVKVVEEELDAELLAETIRRLLADERKLLGQMKENIGRFKRQTSHKDLCSVVCEAARIKVR